MFSLIFLSLVVSVYSLPLNISDVSNIEDEPFILYGQKAKPGQFPWQVALAYYGKFICGGTLVEPSKVITAAHCIGSGSGRGLTVMAGGVKYIKLEQSVDVASAKNDPRWKPDPLRPKLIAPYDYAELILAEPLKIEKGNVETIEPAGKEFRDIALERLNKCWASGWGARENNKDPNSLSFYEASVSNRDTEYATIDTCTDRPCIGFGDSGGPLVCEVDGKKYLFGATSGRADQSTCSKFAEVSESQK